MRKPFEETEDYSPYTLKQDLSIHGNDDLLVLRVEKSSRYLRIPLWFFHAPGLRISFIPVASKVLFDDVRTIPFSRVRGDRQPVQRKSITFSEIPRDKVIDCRGNVKLSKRHSNAGDGNRLCSGTVLRRTAALVCPDEILAAEKHHLYCF